MIETEKPQSKRASIDVDLLKDQKEKNDFEKKYLDHFLFLLWQNLTFKFYLFFNIHIFILFNI